MRYRVAFLMSREYEVEADDEGEAEDKAYKEFVKDMSYPVAHTDYDEIEIECLEEDE